jgi:hypothetical protein
MEERRRCQRIRVKEAVQVKVNAGVTATIIDISPLGALLEISKALRPSSSCSISFAAGGGSLTVRARVQRCRVTTKKGCGLVYVAGVEFLDVSDQEAKTLRSVFKLPPVISTPRSANQLSASCIEKLLLAV